MKKQIFLPVLYLIISVLLMMWNCPVAASEATAFPRIRIEGDKLYAGEEELFLNAVGYAGIRPGKDQFDPISDANGSYALVEEDMRRIREAGFNAIRTWALLDPAVIEMARRHGLWVAGGIWTEPRVDPFKRDIFEKSVETVRKQARIYARYPNVAMIFIVNEPEPSFLFDPRVKKHMARMADIVREEAPGIPVTFSNMPNAPFADPAPFEIISQNIYAQAYADFQSSVGYRGLVEGVRRLCGGGKPFFISEFGFYAPVPRPDPTEPWIYFVVGSEDEQSRNLRRDIRALRPLGLAGMALMLWADDWRCFGEVPQAHPYIEDLKENKNRHDQFSQEWGGIMRFEGGDPAGTPRQAYHDVMRVNQAILIQPDPEAVYAREVPVAVYVNDSVKTLKWHVNGRLMGEAARTSAHWFRFNYAAADGRGQRLKKHLLRIEALDEAGNVITVSEEVFWTGAVPGLPVMEVRKSPGGDGFAVLLQTPAGDPMPDAKIRWGLLDVFNWKDYGGDVQTDARGRAVFKVPRPGMYLAGAGFVFEKDGYRKRVTDLDYGRL